MRIRVRNFGIARDLCGGPSTELDLPDGTSADGLRARLFELFPGLAALGSLAVAVNEEYALGPEPLREGDDIALIPPVSGG